MSVADDERLGQLLVLLRRRGGWRQEDVAAAANVPRREVIVVEAGGAGSIELHRLRRIFEAAGARGRFAVWWNGAAADRLIDERHAALVERAVAYLKRRDWLVAVELSFSEFGERGSIDVFGAKPTHRAIAVIEVKSDVGSTEEMNRILDVKVRLAPKIASERFGWQPAIIGRIVVLPDASTQRRLVERHSQTMASVYPARGREVRAWLRAPSGPLRGIWFLSEVRDRHTRSPRDG